MAYKHVWELVIKEGDVGPWKPIGFQSFYRGVAFKCAEHHAANRRGSRIGLKRIGPYEVEREWCLEN